MSRNIVQEIFSRIVKMVLIWVILLLCSTTGGSPCWSSKDNHAIYKSGAQLAVALAGLSNSSGATGSCLRDSEDEICPEPLVFCPTSSCCLGGGRCGCWNGRWRICQDVPSYFVNVSTCSEDGLRVSGIYQVGAMANIEGGLASELCEMPAEASIETGSDGELGIRVTTTSCWRNHGEFTVLLGYSVRIEDPDGFLIEKFLFRILQNVNIGQLMAEFSRHGESALGEESILKLEKFLGSYNFAWTRSKDSWWGCESRNAVVRVDPAFISALAIVPTDEDMIGEGFQTTWEDCTDDGILGSTSAVTYFSPEICQNSGAIVDLKMHAYMEWSLNITLVQCLPPSNRPGFIWKGRFTPSLILSEAAFYNRFMKAAKAHVFKKMNRLEQ